MCHGQVLDTARHDEELTLVQQYVAISQLDREPPTQHQEQLIFPVVLVPDELALELHELDELPIQLSDDACIPGIREQAQLFLQVYLLQLTPPRYSPHPLFHESLPLFLLVHQSLEDRSQVLVRERPDDHAIVDDHRRRGADSVFVPV